MMADADAASARPTRILLERLLATLEPVAARLGAERWIVHAHALVERGGPAAAQRAVANECGIGGVAAWLAGRFLEQPLVG
jgi:gamma-glutamyl:cysteine ligase YbdK (ATP-grasp superfamily)